MIGIGMETKTHVSLGMSPFKRRTSIYRIPVTFHLNVIPLSHFLYNAFRHFHSLQNLFAFFQHQLVRICCIYQIHYMFLTQRNLRGVSNNTNKIHRVIVSIMLFLLLLSCSNQCECRPIKLDYLKEEVSQYPVLAHENAHSTIKINL